MTMTVERAPGVASPSLDLYAISVPKKEAPSVEGKCPHKLDFQWVNAATGEVRPARCRRNGCGYCGPLNARLIGGAIALAQPERLVTLTQVGDEWQTIRARMKRLAYDLRSAGRKVQWSWHVEPNPEGTGHHVHGFQRGDFLPQRELASLADKRGMGEVADIRKWQTRGRSAGYGVKLAGVSYGLKNVESSASMGTYLRANGGRLVHTTRGFWLDGEGQPVGQREAMTAWARAGRKDDESEWRLMRVA